MVKVTEVEATITVKLLVSNKIDDPRTFVLDEVQNWMNRHQLELYSSKLWVDSLEITAEWPKFNEIEEGVAI